MCTCITAHTVQELYCHSLLYVLWDKYILYWTGKRSTTGGNKLIMITILMDQSQFYYARAFHPSPGRVLCNSIVKKDGWLFGCVLGGDPRMTSENCQGLESKSTQCKIYFLCGKHHSAVVKRSVLKILRYHPFYLKYYRVSTYVVAFHEDSLHWGVAHQSLINSDKLYCGVLELEIKL